jgi:hypothetical protein
MEAMRQATIEEEKKVFQEQLAAQKARSSETLRARQVQIKQATTERDEALALIQANRAADEQKIKRIARNTTRTVRKVEVCLNTTILILAAGGIINYFTGVLTEYRVWTLVVGTLLAAFGLYHMVMNVLERPKIGIPSLMAALAKRLFISRIRRVGLDDRIKLDQVNYTKGRIEVPLR